MICPDPRCTGVHNRNRPWADVCPRIKEAGLAAERRRYARQTWFEHHAKQLDGRRRRALKRMEKRGLSG